MSLTSGFYDSQNGDRRYSSQQMSAIFDGIINDGVFASIGTAFAVTENSGRTVNVGVGRAWFNSKWVYNDSVMAIEAEEAEVSLDRYDAVIIEINNTRYLRRAAIKIIKGEASSEPKRPAMVKRNEVYQYPLAYIHRKAGSTEIKQADIKSCIGTSECPFVTGILQVMAIDAIVAQWEAQWVRWFDNIETENSERMDQLINDKQTEFETWFNSLQVILAGDVATNLASQIVELQNRVKALETEHYPIIEDSTGNAIEDSNGTVIEGKLLYEYKII